MKYRSLNRNRDYMNQMFGADLSYMLQYPRNRFLIIDFATQLFNKLQRWGLPFVQGRHFSLNTVNENDTFEKMQSYPMVSIGKTYIDLQLFLDRAYLFVNPITGSTFNPLNGYNAGTDNYNYVSDEAGLYTGPIFPFAGDMEASDATVIQAGPFATPQDWETAWNTLLRPYENSLGTSYVGLYGSTLVYPSGSWPYIRHTASVNNLGEAIFRLSPDQPDVSLITTFDSTGEHRVSPKAQRGPFIGPTRPYRRLHPQHAA